MTTRKGFLASSLAAGASAMLGGCRMFRDTEVGKSYPGWHEGEMDLHFIYTGCGENTFFRFPDGTTVLCDTGEFYRPQASFIVPLLPSRDLLGGEWVARYLRYVCGALSPFKEKAVDYAIFTHWHSDHIGHAVFDGTDGPGAAWRYRKTADGRKINGFLCVAEQFRFRRYLDHQYPTRNAYRTADSSINLLAPWVDAQKAKGALAVESFKPGALDQIALVRNPRKYHADFHVRNICTNGVLWDGAHGVRDYAAEHVAATGKDSVPQNSLSLGYVVEYGKFRFFTAGDFSGPGDLGRGSKRFYPEGEIGKAAGKVDVAKINHHGHHSMVPELVRNLQARVYVACIWDQLHVTDDTMTHLSDTSLYPGERTIFPGVMTAERRAAEGDRPWMRNVPEAVYEGSHIVLSVPPGGETYRITCLTAADESMRIKAAFDYRSHGVA